MLRIKTKDKACIVHLQHSSDVFRVMLRKCMDVSGENNSDASSYCGERFGPLSRLELGSAIRHCGEHYALALYIAVIEMIVTNILQDKSIPRSDFYKKFSDDLVTDLAILTDLESIIESDRKNGINDRANIYHKHSETVLAVADLIAQAISALELEDSWDMKPLLTGNDLMKVWSSIAIGLHN